MWWLATEMKTNAVVGGTGEDEVGTSGRKKNRRWRHDEVIVVAKGEGRGIVGEAQGGMLVLSWWKEEGVVGEEFWRIRRWGAPMDFWEKVLW